MSASLAWAATPTHRPIPGKADEIIVLKHKRLLVLARNGRVLKTYPVALGLHPVGPKLWEGDGKTPEGIYQIDGRNEASRYHLALHVSYPGPADAARAERAHRPVGGAIMIHGMPNWFSALTMEMAPDWTSGCIAVSDAAIEEIWDAVDDGTPIEIRP
jgi:murein L,D-transpeptidase YafK